MINLISDTVTQPSSDMLDFMMKAKVGDDVFGEDSTVNELQDLAASMFGMEAALFCPSGTMTNQIALRLHTGALDEVLCDVNSHIFQYETGGYAYNSGLAIKTIQGQNGLLKADLLADKINPNYDWLPSSKLVVLENTANKGGGSYYEFEDIEAIRELCNSNNMALHLDGARLFNALVETGEDPKAYGQVFDSISICLSKGLGAPVGSLLLADQKKIDFARRLRKVMGGGMRQAGYLAAAGIYALQNNVELLKVDNAHARKIGKVLTEKEYVKSVKPVKSNILIFELDPSRYTGQEFLDQLKLNEIKASAFGKNTIRFVTHLDLSETMIQKTIVVLENL